MRMHYGTKRYANVKKKKFTTFDAQLAVMLVREKLVVMAHYYYS